MHSRVDRAVKEGKTLYESLNKYPYIFNETFRSLVRAGEASGELPAILAKLALYLEEQTKLKNKMLATLTYPAVMVIASIGVIIVLMTQVVPNITSVLLEQGKELPMATEILINSSNFLSNWWWLLILLIVILFVFIKQYYRTKAGRYLITVIETFARDLISKNSNLEICFYFCSFITFGSGYSQINVYRKRGCW